MNSTSFLLDQPCADTSYSHAAATPSFLPKSDFPQVGDSSPQGPVPARTQDPAVCQGGTEDSAGPQIVWRHCLFWGTVVPFSPPV